MVVFGALLCAWCSVTGTLELRYDGDVPPDRAVPPWGTQREVANCSFAAVDGVLHVVDQGTAKGELQFFSYAWGAIPTRRHSLEARVKVGSCSGDAGVILLAANGELEAGLTLYPDRLELHNLKAAAPVRLDDDFHVVRFEMQNADLRVSVDGRVVIDLTGKWTWPAHQDRNLVGFGSCSSAATGEAWWDWVRAESEVEDVELYPDAEHFVIFRQPDVYACFPSCYALPDGTLWTSFGTRVRRSHIDNTGGSAARVSTDGGRTWSEPPPGFRAYNPDAVRADGHLAHAGAIGWRYAKTEEAAALRAAGWHVRDARPGEVAYLSGAQFSVRRPDGTAVVPATDIALPKTSGMMGFNQNAYLNAGGGLRLVAIYSVGESARDRDAYVLRSEDDGDSWECLPLALGDERMSYNETALGANAEGHIIALLRTAESPDPKQAGRLYQSVSTDRGRTWSTPTDTGIWGYPADLDRLPDGRLVATYGYRRAPMGIRACLSRDGGRTWDVDHEIVLRADGFGNGSDLGYPVTNRLADGTLVTVYYFNDRENVTHVCATRWRPPVD